jgi:hypothetical protein
MTWTDELVARWRSTADAVAKYHGEVVARPLRECAADLEAAAREQEDSLLTPLEAERESGYSRRRLRELEAAGQLVNRGRKGSPRYRRSELPRKPQPDIDAAVDRLMARRRSA